MDLTTPQISYINHEEDVQAPIEACGPPKNCSNVKFLHFFLFRTRIWIHWLSLTGSSPYLKE